MALLQPHSGFSIAHFLTGETHCYLTPLQTLSLLLFIFLIIILNVSIYLNSCLCNFHTVARCLLWGCVCLKCWLHYISRMGFEILPILNVIFIFVFLYMSFFITQHLFTLASILSSVNFYLTFDILNLSNNISEITCFFANSLFSPLFIMWRILGDYGCVSSG